MLDVRTMEIFILIITMKFTGRRRTSPEISFDSLALRGKCPRKIPATFQFLEGLCIWFLSQRLCPLYLSGLSCDQVINYLLINFRLRCKISHLFGLLRELEACQIWKLPFIHISFFLYKSQSWPFFWTPNIILSIWKEQSYI